MTSCFSIYLSKKMMNLTMLFLEKVALKKESLTNTLKVLRGKHF